eukprot:SAG22_NODE_9308_length_597_cov_1.040161_2_plen_131_part_01
MMLVDKTSHHRMAHLDAPVRRWSSLVLPLGLCLRQCLSLPSVCLSALTAARLHHRPEPHPARDDAGHLFRPQRDLYRRVDPGLEEAPGDRPDLADPRAVDDQPDRPVAGVCRAGAVAAAAVLLTEEEKPF